MGTKKDKESILNELAEAVSKGDDDAVTDIAQNVLTSGIDPMEAINWASKGLDLLGEKYERLEVYLPDLILGGDAMRKCFDILLPHLRTENTEMSSSCKIVIGTVAGDVHDIGKNLVSAMLSVKGFEVYDLGRDVPSKQFVEKAEEVKATFIALSTLVSTSMYFQEDVIRYLKDYGVRNKYYVIVGGGPITPQWATQIGADGHARLAVNASELVKKILEAKVPPPLSQPIITGY
jgi:corrinoid protein of di/trimethylamine methyltransferase